MKTKCSDMITPLILSLLTSAVSGDAVTIRTLSSPREIEVRLALNTTTAAQLRDADEPLSKVLTLALVDDDGNPGPAMFADIHWRRNTLVLRPGYRLSPGVEYRVTARVPQLAVIEKSYRVPDRPSGPAPRVHRIEPAASVLPANCVKFYVHFTQPMQQGPEVFEQIQLVDDRGNVIPHPWRRAELWNAESDRLTLWIHPGRVKQGVNLREDFGPVFKQERKYSLVVTQAVRNLDGVVLAKPYVKEFATVAEDHQRPDPRQWGLTRVRAGSRDPLVVNLDETLDRALLTRMLTVKSKTKQLRGKVVAGADGKTWTFTPQHVWPNGRVVLIVSDRLEDLAGNTPARVFDTDLTQAPAEMPTLQIAIPKSPDHATSKDLTPARTNDSNTDAQSAPSHSLPL